MLAFELANVCLVKTRRHPAPREALIAAFGLRTRVAVEAAAVDCDSALALAMRTGLTVYDASYLWLANQLGAELVTLDQRLAEAARREPAGHA